MSDTPVYTPPEICSRCGGVGTVGVVTKTIGGAVRYYFKCSDCNYLWPVPKTS